MTTTRKSRVGQIVPISRVCAGQWFLAGPRGRKPWCMGNGGLSYRYEGQHDLPVMAGFSDDHQVKIVEQP